MRARMRFVVGASAVAVVLAAACTDATRSTGPNMQAVSGKADGLLGGLLGGLTSLLVPPVNRTTPLPSDVSWSFSAGPGGVTSTNASVGLTVAIPSGALSSTQTITVTALAGAPVAYKFEPHGLVFSKKAYLTQDLNGTTAGPLTLLLKGAYFATDRLQLNSSGLAIVTELLAAVVNPFSQTVTFGIQHFSGYIVASGLSGDSEGYEAP